MYYALKDGQESPVERLRWVKLQANGVFITCAEDEGQGIIVNGEIYHVYGRPTIDKPTVTLIWHDDVTALKEDNFSTMTALTEVFETTLAQSELSESIMLAITELYETMLGG